MFTAPKDVPTNREYRRWLMKRAADNKRVREACVELSKHDPVWWIDSFAWQFNPRVRGEGAVAPFVCWDFQESVVRKIDSNVEADRDLIIEKSREVGGTFMVLLALVRRAAMLRWQNFLCISHSEKAVYSPGDKNSLFYKLKFIADRLPEWLVGPVIHRKLGMEFTRTDSNFTGAATTQRAGVGGRVTAVFGDEFALQTDDQEIWSATADLGCRVICSTHYGLGTKFYQLCQTAHEDRRDKVVLHWSQHPMKKQGLYKSGTGPHHWTPLDPAYQYEPDFLPVLDGKPNGGPCPGIRSPWYDDEVRRRGSLRDVALHLDIDCAGATAQAADAEVIERLIRENCRPPLWEGYLEFDPSGKPDRLIQKKGGSLRLWIYPDSNGKVPFAQYAFGCDVANGRGATPSCMSGGNAETGEKVLEYRDPWIKPTDFATLAVAVCWLFRTPGGQGAKLCWECPGPGQDMGDKVVELGYGNIHRHVTEGKTKLMVSADGKPGYYMTPNGKATLFREYLSLLVTNHLINRSEPAMREVLSYSYTPKTGVLEHGQIDSKDDPSGARVNHGDLVIADALMAKMLKGLGLGKPDAPVVIDTRPPEGSLAYRQAYHRRRERELEEA